MVRHLASRWAALAALVALPVVSACSNEPAPSDASLQALTISAGSLNPAFDAAVSSYSVHVPWGTATVTVTPTAKDAAARITVSQDGGAAAAVASGTPSADLAVPATGGRSSIAVAVTGKDGKTTQTYTIALFQAGNSDATLASIALAAGGQAFALNEQFASDTFDYTANVPAGSTKFTVTPTASFAGASITVKLGAGQASPVASGTASPEYDAPAFGTTATVTIVVTAADGATTDSYEVVVTQAANLATLASIEPSLGALSPAFASDTTTYTLTAPHDATSITLKPTASDPQVQSIMLAVDGGLPHSMMSGEVSPTIAVPAVGAQSIITITVKSRDGSVTATYTLTLRQAPAADATLESLAMVNAILTPGFSSSQPDYAVTVDYVVESATFTVSATDPNAYSITVNGASAAVVGGSADVPLVAGQDNLVTIIVTAEDEETQKTYTVTVHRKAADTDDTLKTLVLSAGTLQLVAGTTEYTVEDIPHATTSLTVTIEPTSLLAHDVTLVQDTDPLVSVIVGEPMSLDVPPVSTVSTPATSTVTIVVTAESLAQETYTLHLSRLPSTDASLASLTTTDTAASLVPKAGAADTWTLTVPNGATTATFTPTATDVDIHSMTVAQGTADPVPLASGTAWATTTIPAPLAVSTIEIVVTAQDESTQHHYWVELAQAAQDDASLSELWVSPPGGLPFTMPFNPANKSYSLVVPHDTTEVTVTPTATSAQVDSITVGLYHGADLVSTQTVPTTTTSTALAVPAPWDLDWRIDVVVTAQDKVTTATYSIAISQAPDTRPELETLAYDTGRFSPAFDGNTSAYTLRVGSKTESVSLTPTAVDPDVYSISITQTGGVPQSVATGAPWAVPTMPAAGASTTITIVVTAQDRSTQATYTVTLIRTSGSDATLASLADSAGGLKGFDPNVTAYSYSLPTMTTVGITPTALDADATITVAGVTTPSGQTQNATLTAGIKNQVDVVVTPADGTSPSQTYSLMISQVGLITPRDVASLLQPATPILLDAGQRKPAPGDDPAPVDTLLRLGFDDTPTIGTTGTIKIFQVGNATPVDTIDLANDYAIYDGVAKNISGQTSSMVNIIGLGGGGSSPQVRVVNYIPILVNGNTVTIVPHNYRLAYGSSYYVTIDSGVLNGKINLVDFNGIGPGEWTFSTKASKPATFNVDAANNGDYATVQGAIDATANGSSSTPVTILIAKGVYQEMLFLRGKYNITFQGTDPDASKTVIQYENCDGFNPGVGAGATPIAQGGDPGTPPTIAQTGSIPGGGRTVVLISSSGNLTFDHVTIRNLHPQGDATLPTIPTRLTGNGVTFTNYTTGATQAEVLYFNAGSTKPYLVGKYSNFLSFQDTLQIKGYTWWYDSFIAGDVDFIWGAANAALFERSEIFSRYNASNQAAIVQSRAPQGAAGFVFLNCALTREDTYGAFDAYLARSNTTGYDIVAYVGCTMDSHIKDVGWLVNAGNPAGPNLPPSAALGWREYKSHAPDGSVTNVDARLWDATGTTVPNYGSKQLTDFDATTLYPNRHTILNTGANEGTCGNNGTCNYNGNAGFDPQP